MKERTAAIIFVVAYPIAAALGLGVHPEPLPIDAFLAVPLLWPIATFFRRFKATTTSLEVETNEVKTDLTTAIDAVEEKTRALPGDRTTNGTPLATSLIHTDHLSIGSSLYIVSTDEAMRPRDDISDLLAVTDDVTVQLAALRIAIERELQNIAELARVQGAHGARTFPLKHLVSELLRYELLPHNLEQPLIRVIDMANRAIHGAPVEQGADEIVANLGPRLIDGMRRLPSTASWLTALVTVRAGDQDALNALGEEVTRDVSISRGTGEVLIHISPSPPSDPQERNDGVRFVSVTPPSADLTQSLVDNEPLAWVQDHRIFGTPSAKTMAPWLIDNVVKMSVPPPTPQP